MSNEEQNDPSTSNQDTEQVISIPEYQQLRMRNEVLTEALIDARDQLDRIEGSLLVIQQSVYNARNNIKLAIE